MRTKYLNKVFDHTIRETRNLFKDEYIYVSLDGTTDKKGRQVAAFIVGSLQDVNKGPFLINLKTMESGTAEAYYRFFEESLSILYEGTGNSTISFYIGS